MAKKLQYFLSYLGGREKGRERRERASLMGVFCVGTLRSTAGGSLRILKREGGLREVTKYESQIRESDCV